MLDDDCRIFGSQEGVKQYMEQIKSHPSGFGEFSRTLLKLFAISKDIFKEVKFNETLNHEKGEGFEDRYFVNYLRQKYPTKQYMFRCSGLYESSVSTADPYST